MKGVSHRNNAYRLCNESALWNKMTHFKHGNMSNGGKNKEDLCQGK